MFTTVTVALPTHTLLTLIEQLKRRGASQDLSEAISAAVECWLADQKQFPKTADPNGLHGYQWKCLFLPEGTVLRSWSYGENNYACVEGDEIIHRGRSVTPNEFARAFARTNRNAWLDLRIRRPGDKQFRQADLLRKEVQREQEEARKAKASLATQAIAPLQAPAALAPPAPPSPAHAPQPPLIAQSPPPAAPRDPTPGEGWTLPERRKWRFRFEDIAFD
jgi:hypothetical protein